MFKSAAASAAVSPIIEFQTAAMLGILTSSYKGYKMSRAVFFCFFFLNDTTEAKRGATSEQTAVICYVATYVFLPFGAQAVETLLPLELRQYMQTEERCLMGTQADRSGGAAARRTLGQI